MTAGRRTAVELVALFACALMAVLVIVPISEYRAARHAAPGDQLVVFYPENVSTAQALRRIGEAGAIMSDPLAFGNGYRVLVLPGTRPAALAGDGWLFRDPVAAMAQCFGVATASPSVLNR